MEPRIPGALAQHVSWQERVIEGMVEDRKTRVDARRDRVIQIAGQCKSH